MKNPSISPIAPVMNQRLFALDLLKAISISAVVSYHGIFVPRATYANHFLSLELLSAPLRFCVPVFFTISFLLMEKGWKEGNTWILIQHRFRRLVIPLAFWFGLAALSKFVVGASLPEVSISIFQGKIFQGAYYLLALLQFLLPFILLRKFSFSGTQIIIITLLQSLVYSSVWFIIGQPIEFLFDALNLFHRSFAIYWFVYAFIGIYFARQWGNLKAVSQKVSNFMKILLIGLLMISLWTEYGMLLSITHGHSAPFEYVMFSCILSVYVLFLCTASIEEEQIWPPLRHIVYLLSTYSLGIYCINGILSEVLLSLGSKLWGDLQFTLIEILIIKLLGWIFLMISALGLAMGMDRLGLKVLIR